MATDRRREAHRGRGAGANRAHESWYGGDKEHGLPLTRSWVDVHGALLEWARWRRVGRRWKEPNGDTVFMRAVMAGFDWKDGGQVTLGSCMRHRD